MDVVTLQQLTAATDPVLIMPGRPLTSRQWWDEPIHAGQIQMRWNEVNIPRRSFVAHRSDIYRGYQDAQAVSPLEIFREWIWEDEVLSHIAPIYDIDCK
jgi:hypothetical protein